MVTTFFHSILLLLGMITLCSGDILSYFLFEYHTTYFLLSFLITYYWYRQSLWILCIGLPLLAIESFIMYESSLIVLLIALPTFFFITMIRHRLYSTPLQPLVTLATFLLLDIYLIKGLLKGQTVNPLYTISLLFGNMILVLVFSLKLNGGKTRQSLMPLV